jgi:hypothetical protein
MNDISPTMEDLDPSAPSPEEMLNQEQFEAARQLANYGDPALQDFDKEFEREATEALAPPPAMPLTIDVAKAYLRSCQTCTPRVGYRLGAKIPSLSSVPGRDFDAVDCSGLVRRLIQKATDPMVRFPDGSVVQQDWVRDQRYRGTTIAAGKLQDGKVRIGFLAPWDTASRIGHVVLIHNGMTLESHGGVGPNSRPWNGSGWQRI